MGGSNVETGVIDPAHSLGEFDAKDSGYCLEHDQENVEVPLNEVIVAV